jgi:hypothetical protein
MRYDIVINASSAGTIDAEYSVTWCRRGVHAGRAWEFKAKKPIEEAVSWVLEGQGGSTDDQPTMSQSA